jgi:AcrR family transcriptional regulator
MAAMAGTDGAADLEVRAPRQQRSREEWERALDAGVAILEDAGYQASTIAAVCEGARVTSPAIYARTASLDRLFVSARQEQCLRAAVLTSAAHPGSAAAAPTTARNWGTASPWWCWLQPTLLHS